MENGAAWKGDWTHRIRERVKKQGFATLNEFLLAHPTQSFLELADQLGLDIAAIQLEQLHRQDAEDAGEMVTFARSCLVRRIHQKLPDGWGRQKEMDARASAFAKWSAALGPEYQERVRNAWELANSLDIPADWLPSGPDDEFIVRIVEAAGFGE